MVLRFIVDESEVLFVALQSKQEEEELWALRPGVNEASFCARPHHNVHHTLGVDTGAIGPRGRVHSID
jgi:hypothetical protein